MREQVATVATARGPDEWFGPTVGLSPSPPVLLGQAMTTKRVPLAEPPTEQIAANRALGSICPQRCHLRNARRRRSAGGSVTGGGQVSRLDIVPTDGAAGERGAMARADGTCWTAAPRGGPTRIDCTDGSSLTGRRSSYGTGSRSRVGHGFATRLGSRKRG